MLRFKNKPIVIMCHFKTVQNYENIITIHNGILHDCDIYLDSEFFARLKFLVANWKKKEGSNVL